MTERYLTTNEVAEITRTSPSTVRYWRHTGYGPKSFRVGRRVLTRESDLQAWLHERAAADVAQSSDNGSSAA